MQLVTEFEHPINHTGSPQDDKQGPPWQEIEPSLSQTGSPSNKHDTKCNTTHEQKCPPYVLHFFQTTMLLMFTSNGHFS